MTAHSFHLERGGVLQAEVRREDGRASVRLQLERVNEPCILHWGVGQGPRHWLVPPQDQWPAASRDVNGAAVQTPFPAHSGTTLPAIVLAVAPDASTIDFVLFFPASGRWDNNRGRNYHVALRADQPPAADLVQVIVERETGPHSWTLMHRFDLCHDLLDRVPQGDLDGLSLIFVWLRFSAIRQLDWQRNYNTKPRELAHAQDRLTLKLAERFASHPEERTWLRLIMTTVGRGGEGQRVRDEVLDIMHRHHIKEVSGHFMEEWHQKLHNNTTPDDVVLCEAYLAFLRSDGNRDVFYRTLEHGGVSRARLQSFERPIRSDPDFIPYLKDALIHDFEEFLRVLKRLHSGTDLGAASHDARAVLDEGAAGIVNWLAAHQSDDSVETDTLAAQITEARSRIGERLRTAGGTDAARVRTLVYLDLALEDLLRLAIERRLHTPPGMDQLVGLVGSALQNLAFTDADDEVRACLRFWERLRTTPRDRIWALGADADIERSGRAASASLDRFYQALQGKAETLGRAFHAEPWAIATFSEEVVRGRAAIIVPRLARLVRRALRRDHRLPAWQIVSGGQGHSTAAAAAGTPRAVGTLQIVDALESIQAARFEPATVVIAMKVGGQEEMPDGVTAVITPCDVDILSHVGIRARNAGVLFATCDDADEVDRLKALAGRQVAASVEPDGSVRVELDDSDAGAGSTRAHRRDTRRRASAVDALRAGRRARAGPTRYALSASEFTPQTVGSKALNLARLQGALPSWIRVPLSVAIPFGTFEETLEQPANAGAARRYDELLAQLNHFEVEDRDARAPALQGLRATIRTLAAPEAFMSALQSVMERAGLALPDAHGAWSCITGVWSSKWNERAFLSRQANGLLDADVMMSVLVQAVVEADYAFVIHTANPSTGAADELYAEVVRGLGETLVGAHPGRAMSLTWRKADSHLELQAVASKSRGLFAGSAGGSSMRPLIFRSDSNAEDLAHYAGAGLYDSIMLPLPREVVLDYTDEPLVWDDDFRRTIAGHIARIGLAVEHALGGPQDIEGACVRDEWHVLQARPQVGLPDES